MEGIIGGAAAPPRTLTAARAFCVILLLADIPARWALGTEMHIIGGATTGGAIGCAVEARNTVRRILIPLAVIASVVVTHDVQNWMGNYIAPLSIAAIEGPLTVLGLTPNMVVPGTLVFSALLVYSTTVNTLLVNLLVIPILVLQVRKSRWISTSASSQNHSRSHNCLYAVIAACT
jgi:hypothetical protein